MKQPQSAGWKAIQQSNQDHNSPWKDILEGYCREFIAFFFPWIEKERGNLLEQERSNGDLIPFFTNGSGIEVMEKITREQYSCLKR
jgi:hypothetical protein